MMRVPSFVCAVLKIRPLSDPVYLSFRRPPLPDGNSAREPRRRQLEIDSSTIRTFANDGSLLPGKNLLPVVLHADDKPALRLGLVIQCLGEGAHLGIRQSLGRAVGIQRRS